MTSQPPSQPSQPSSPRSPRSWRRSELLALLDRLTDGVALLDRVLDVEHGRTGHQLLADGQRAIVDGRLAVERWARMTGLRDGVPADPPDPPGEPLPFP